MLSLQIQRQKYLLKWSLMQKTKHTSLVGDSVMKGKLVNVYFNEIESSYYNFIDVGCDKELCTIRWPLNI